MKYIAVIDTDDFKDFEFFEDGNGKYLVTKDAGAKNDEWIPLYFTECEQEPKTGHWNNVSICGYRCSECGKIQYADDVNELNYCCTCGAKMIRHRKGAIRNDRRTQTMGI